MKYEEYDIDLVKLENVRDKEQKMDYHSLLGQNTGGLGGRT